jgi:hypothetical protein
MKPLLWTCLAVSAMVVVAAGCSSSGPRLYKAGGTVTRNKKPVEGAHVTFAYDNGNFATGHTDAAGKFQLTYQNRPGGAVPGKCTVTVSKKGAGGPATPAPAILDAPPKSAEGMKAKMAAQQKAMEEATKRAEAKSPDDFMKTGFTFEITTDESKNNFEIEIKD